MVSGAFNVSGPNKPSPSHHPGLLRGLGELLRGLGSCELRLQCLGEDEDGHFYGETDGKKLEFEWKLQGDNHFYPFLLVKFQFVRNTHMLL